MSTYHDTKEFRIPKSLNVEDLVTNRPTAPVLWYEREGIVLALPMLSCSVLAEIHVTTAFVQMDIKFQNTSGHTIDALFAFPCQGTVTSVVAIIGKEKALMTGYIPNEDIEEFQEEGDPLIASINHMSPFEQFIPDLFRLPIDSIEPDEIVSVKVDFLQTLLFFKQRYNCSICLKVIPGTHAEIPISDLINIKCIFDTFHENISFKSNTHSLKVMKSDSQRVEIKATPRSNQTEDFQFCYWLKHQEILPIVIHQNAAPNALDPRNSFLIFVAPPTSVSEALPRDFIFLLDRSDSMTGAPYKEALKALKVACGRLLASDRFTIIAFDHEMEYFSKTLQTPSQEVLNNVAQWAASTLTRGGTNISQPLYWALGILNEQSKNSDGNMSRLPIVFLITDGCVSNEREIIKEVKVRCKNVRLFTFGIGLYCNWYFLKMLSQIGRGFSDSIVYPESIYQQMLDLMEYANLPILTSISFEAAGIGDVEICPSLVPDLFAGSPIIVSGKYTGVFPRTVMFRGIKPSGGQFEVRVETTFTKLIPIDSVFLKQKMDILSAEHWFWGDEKHKRKVAELSCAENVPSSVTSMIVYKTSQSKVSELKKDRKEKQGSKWSKENVVKLSTGTVVVVGAAMFTEGDLAATDANIPMTDIFLAGGDDGCCDQCADLFVSCNEGCVLL